MNPQAKIIYLDEYHSHPIAIAASAFAEIERQVLAARVCRICALPYTQETGNRPRVTQNICLVCYLKKQQDTYTFVGKDETESRHYTTYLYLDVKGIVHYSTTAHEDKPQESIEMTLRFYGFPVPESYTENDQPRELSGGDWYLRGDVRNQSALVIEYIKHLGDYRHIPFLTTKHGEAVFLDKRRGNTRRLYQAAKKQHEASKDRRGYYHLHGREIGNFYETDVYRIVSDLASAEHDTSKKDEGK